MSQLTACDKCGARLGPDSSSVGLCPACLLETALQDEDNEPSEASSTTFPGFPVGAKFGSFRMGNLLGKGGMAAVYDAYEAPPLARTVALKVLPPEFLHDDTFANRFGQEARVVANLEHPHIVPIYASGIEAGIPWISMRLLAGGSLATLLARGPLDLVRTTKILRDVADALDYAHARGVIHRDVKPSNILIDEAGRAYVCDFGLARVLQGPDGWTRTGTVVGTPHYMAPEQGAGGLVDWRCDIYSLGIVAYEMLTGAPPFTGPSPLAILMQHAHAPLPAPARELVPEAVLAALKKALGKQPSDRWPTASAFAAAFEQACRPPSRSRWSPRIAAVVGTSAVAASAAAFYWAAFSSTPTVSEPALVQLSSTTYTSFARRPPSIPPRNFTTTDSRDVASSPGPNPSIDPVANTPNTTHGAAAPNGQPPSAPVSTSPNAEGLTKPASGGTPERGAERPSDVNIDIVSVPSGPPAPAGEVITAPIRKKTVNPAYPQIAKAAPIQGDVLLQATVGLDGRVTDVEVVRSVHPLLDEAARKAVLQFEYTPGLRNGVPTASKVQVQVSFRLSK